MKLKEPYIKEGKSKGEGKERRKKEEKIDNIKTLKVVKKNPCGKET